MILVNLGLELTQLPFDIIESSNLVGEGPLEGRGIGVQLKQKLTTLLAAIQTNQLTSLNWSSPSSPSAATTSRPISFAI